MVATDTNIAKMITIGLPNSLKAMSRKNSRGKFSLGHLVIWTHEVAKYDMEIAFLSVLTTGIKSVVCCQQLRGDNNNNYSNYTLWSAKWNAVINLTISFLS